MKKTKLKMILFAVMGCLFFAACTKEDPEPEPVTPTSSDKIMYVVNEGIMDENNATLSLLNITNGSIQNDYFQTQNNRPLGDVANDLAQYGSKMYCVVNKSSTVEVLNAQTGKSITQIKIIDGQQKGRQPNKITFWKNKAYVCNFDGTVTRIDTATFSIDNLETGTIYAGGICAANNKVYVSNSMGASPELSVINPDNFTVVKTIPVAVNPGKIELDAQGNLLLLSQGDYVATPSCLQKINTQTDAVVQTYNNKASGFCINGDYAYAYLSEWDTPGVSSFFRLNTQTGSIENLALDNSQLSNIIYGIGINPDNGDIYVSGMMSYSEPGDVVCFDKNGSKKSKFEVGVCPSKIVFVK